MPPKANKTKDKSISTKGKTSNSIEATRPPPNWPLMSPIQPTADLSFHTLLQDQILTIPNVWTATLCKTYVSFLSSLPLTTTPGKPKRGDAVRVNDRFQVDDPNFVEKLWSGTAIGELVAAPLIDDLELDEQQRRDLWGGEVLGLNSNIRVYRYSKGQFFDQHYDESNNVNFVDSSTGSVIPAKTTWTLLLYLSSPATGCQGGETVFYPEAASKREAPPPPVVASLELGTLLFHRHGKDCLLHEGREVIEGEKWIIRTDLCVKR